MSQFDIPTIDPNINTGTELSGWINGWSLAVESSHSGALRPAYAGAGMVWLDTSNVNLWTLYVYDGVHDVPLFGFDPNTGTGSGATGDVTGPAGVVADSVAVFDGATGKLLKGGALMSELALLASPTFTGVPLAPTAAPGTNTQQLATTAFVAALGTLKLNAANPAATGTMTITEATEGGQLTLLSSTHPTSNGNIDLVADGSAARIRISGTHLGGAAKVFIFSFNTGDLTVPGNVLTPAIIDNWGQEKLQALGSASGARAPVISAGAYLTATAGGASTWTFDTTGLTAGYATSWTLELTNGGTAAQTFTGVLWAGGTAPTLTAAGTDILVFTKVGAVTRGFMSAKDSK